MERGNMNDYEDLTWILRRALRKSNGVREYVFVAAVDEYCLIYKHEIEYPVIDINGGQNLKQDVTYGFIPQIGNRSSSETKADSSGSLEETSSSNEIPTIRRRSKRNRK